MQYYLDILKKNLGIIICLGFIAAGGSIFAFNTLAVPSSWGAETTYNYTIAKKACDEANGIIGSTDSGGGGFEDPGQNDDDLQNTTLYGGSSGGSAGGHTGGTDITWCRIYD